MEEALLKLPGMPPSLKEIEPADGIVRIIIMDKHGKKAELFANAGEMVYAWHPKHTDDEPVSMYPHSGGTIVLLGDTLSQALDTVFMGTRRPVDFVSPPKNTWKVYEDALYQSEAVDEDTYIVGASL